MFSIRSSIVNTSYGKAELHFTVLFIKMLTHVQQIASFQIIRYECQIDLWFQFLFEANLSGFLAREHIHQHVNISWYKPITCNAPQNGARIYFLWYNNFTILRIACVLAAYSLHAMHIMKLLSRHKKDTSIFRILCVPLFNFLFCQSWWLINFKPLL